MLDAIAPTKKTGNELFINGGQGTLLDYWAWAHSDTIGNAERGKIAEYLVTMAVNSSLGTRTEWDSYDVLTDDGVKVEVKSSGYIQTWIQKEYSKILFGIQPTYKWNEESNTFDSIKKRQADIYVFCVHKHKEQDTANPLDISQWDFFILSTRLLNEKIPNQKTISLNGIQKIGAIKSDFYGLKCAINKAYDRNLNPISASL